MPALVDVNELKALFREGRNLMEELRDRRGTQLNSASTIMLSYDVQAGSYVESLKDPHLLEMTERHADCMASVIETLHPKSILDAGTGEATTLALTLHAMQHRPEFVLAFDISLSRLLYAKEFLASHSCENVRLFTAALENIPLEDNSCDIVITSHAIEPNAGREREVLTELLRVAGRYLVLVEPSWELGSPMTRERIAQHRYIRGLPSILRDLGAKIVRHEKWLANANPSNEAALIVAEKKTAANWIGVIPQLVSPIGLGPLARRNSYLFSRSDGFLFPVIEEVACLLAENGILASGLEDALNQ